MLLKHFPAWRMSEYLKIIVDYFSHSTYKKTRRRKVWVLQEPSTWSGEHRACGVVWDYRPRQNPWLGQSPSRAHMVSHAVFLQVQAMCRFQRSGGVFFFFPSLLWIHKPLWTALHCYYFPSKPEYLCWYSARHWYSIHFGFRFYMGACPCTVFITSVRKWMDSGKTLLFFSSKRWMSKLVV